MFVILVFLQKKKKQDYNVENILLVLSSLRVCIIVEIEFDMISSPLNPFPQKKR